MCIPYGALLLAGGLLGKLLGWGQPALVAAVVGAAQIVLANSSLTAWRTGAVQRATTITLVEAGEWVPAPWHVFDSLGRSRIARWCVELRA